MKAPNIETPEPGDPDVVDFKVGRLNFDAWFKHVDDEVDKITAMSADDFNDWGYADAFESGIEPRQAAIDMLSEDTSGKGFLELAGLENEVSF